MKLNSHTCRPSANTAAALVSAVTKTLPAFCVPIGEPLGLDAAGIDTRLIVFGLLASGLSTGLFPVDLAFILPQAAKRKADDDEDAPEDDEETVDDDAPVDDEEEEDADEEEDDLDEDEDEEDEDDDEEEEEDDEFDDPDDDDFDDDDDEDDFDDDE